MYEKYFARAGETAMPDVLPDIPKDVRRPIFWMDGDTNPGCTMTVEAAWYLKPFTNPGLIAHDEDELIFVCGNDIDNPEELNAEIEFTIENDVLTLTHTCAIYIPAGVAHGDLNVKNVEMPVLHYSCQFNSPHYTSHPAQATAPAGTYADYAVERYAPTSGKLPEAPEGFLQLLLWLAGDKVPGAPYLECVRFCTSNDTGPAPHSHAKDEFIGFIGTDPENPEDLGAEVHFFLGGEDIATTKSTVIFVPGNLEHSPIIVPKMDRPIFHFSGSNATEYIRQGGKDKDKNIYIEGE